MVIPLKQVPSGAFVANTNSTSISAISGLNKESTVEMLIVDEAQDANVPQLTAIKKIAKNVKDNHFYLVGDPDQTIYEYAGSDADYFHKAAAKPFLELKQGFFYHFRAILYYLNMGLSLLNVTRLYL